ncbi:MAG: YebC/PmpR family DNA-binding transcriptional regulator, partial [Vicinamibacteria bacterium]
LAGAIEMAMGYSRPMDNTPRGLDRGAGAGAGDEQIERVVYEGYGPGGAAVLVDTLTDNRNRTGAEVRNLFDKSGGNLGEPGSVAWQFEKKGVILVDGDRFSEDDLMPAIDAGAEDVVLDDDVLKLTTDPTALSAVRSALEGAGVEVQSADLAMEPNAVVEIGEEREARALVRLMEALDDHDDVEAVHANFDIPEALLEQVAA